MQQILPQGDEVRSAHRGNGDGGTDGRTAPRHRRGRGPPRQPRSYDRAGISQEPNSLLGEAEQVVSATPSVSIIRIGVLVAMTLITIGAVATLGVFLVNLSRKDVGTASNIASAQSVISLIRSTIDDVSTLPVCVTNGTVDIGSTFPSSLFAIYRDGDLGTKIRFDLDALNPNASSDVVLTVRKQDLVVNPNGATIALLSDIPSTILTEFSEAVFAIRNSAVESKRLQIDLQQLWFNEPTRTQTLQPQAVSGIVAFKHDISVFGNFLDDTFTIFNEGAASKQVMFDASDAPPDSAVVLRVQNKPGTVLFLDQIDPEVPPFSDDVFRLQHSSDEDARLRFVLDGLIPDTPVTLYGRSTSGTLAYLDDAPQIYEVMISTSRVFPHVDFEGVATLAELGSIIYIDISMCGGGGGGGAFVSPFVGAGGGSGSGHERFPVLNPLSKFTNFDITIGAGGVGAPLSHGEDGGETKVVGISTGTSFYFELSGWGGGGGGRGTGLLAKGGCGGGSGGGATTVDDGPSTTTNTPGPAGHSGGFIGGLGGRVDGQGPDGQPGKLSSSWRAGGGGGAQNGNGAAWLYGLPPRPCPTGGCGADGMFGLGGTAENPTGIGCSGGGRGPTDEAVGGGTGGNGRVLIRYTLG